MIIREATEADIADVLAIYSYYVKNSLATFEESVPSLDEMIGRFLICQNDNLPYLVAVKDNQIVGYAYAFKYRQREAYRFTLEESVYLKNGFQGLRIGQMLLGEIVARVKKLEYRQLIAVITDFDGSGGASIKSHIKHGFCEAGRLKKVGYKFGKWADTVLMQLSL